MDAAWNAAPGEWCTIARNAGDVLKNARDMTAGLVVVAERDGRLGKPGQGVESGYNRHENDIYLRNGAIIHCLSAEKPDRLRGFNLMGCWADELATWKYASETWDYGLMPALRSGAHPRVVVTTTPKPVALLKRLVEEARAEEAKPAWERSKVITTGSTWDNQANLAPNFIAEMRAAYGGTRIGRQELEGELLFDLTGALVSPEMIEVARRSTGEALEESGGYARIVVAVDPAGTYGSDSDETGIVVCAKGRDGHGYVLADRSCRRSPHEWATVAAVAYEEFKADAIAAEKNMGHAMVEDVIRSVAPHVRYIPIQAVQGKRLRAEPVTALYEQGRIHHVGTFPHLEDQLCEWSPESRKSPDRMDALVHGMTELGLVRWGPGGAFKVFMAKEIERRQSGDAEAEATSRALGRVLRRRAPEEGQARRERLCREHRWRQMDGGRLCLYCQKFEDAVST